MDDADRDPVRTFGALAPAAALALVGNEVRAEILLALSEARGGVGSPPVLSFSELRARVDADVDSSQFNYHLQELVGHFVEERSEADAQLVEAFAEVRESGYALRPEGTRLVRAIRAESYEGDPSLDPFDAGLDCYFCSAPVEATFGNGLFKLQCPGCDYLYDYNHTPPGVVADDRETVLSRVAAYNRSVRLSFARGGCPYCGNHVDARVLPGDETGYPRADRRAVLVNRSCDHCGNMDYLTAGEVVLREPALIAFYRERGLDVTRTPIWELAFAATDRRTTVRSRDPWEVAVRVERDGDALELVVDGDLSVVERSGP